MKKTLTVNLGGSIYHIDEDAYTLLDNYLMNLRIHFRREEGADEIVHDMELRISELFTDRLDTMKNIISIEDVEAIITQMGKPEEFSEEAGDEAYQQAEDRNATGGRKLFRDSNNKVLGGVASGLATYLGWDITLLRIAFLALGYFVHGFIIAYIIAWIIIPQARTAAEKLSMKGEAINLENIGRTVTDGFEKVNDYAHSDKPRTLLQRIGEVFVAVVGFLIKFLLIVLAICCAPILFVLLIVCFALLMAATGIIVALPAIVYELNETFPVVDWSVVGDSPSYTIALALSGILIIGIPVIGVIHLLMRYFGGWQPMSMVTKVVFIMLWLIALAVGIFFSIHTPFITPLIY